MSAANAVVSAHAPAALREDSRLGRDRRVLLLAKGLNEAEVAQRRRGRLLDAALGRGVALHGLFDGDAHVEPAPYLNGAVLMADLGNDRLAPSALAGVHAPEPFDVDFHGTTMAVAMADHVVLCDAAAGTVRRLDHVWFRQLHSVCFADDGRRLLVTSGDLDSILEVDVASGDVGWRWTSWENGYAVGADGTRLVRIAADAPDAGARALVVGDFAALRFPRGLATATQPVHVNAAIYTPHDTVLATLFHTGELLEIDPRRGTQHVVLDDLRRPHAVARIPGGYCVTDTQRGVWLRLDRRFRVRERLRLSEIPAKDPGFGELEWIQTICPLGDDLYAAVDCARDRIHVLHPATRTYRSIAVPPSLILQSVRPLRLPDAAALLLGGYGTPTATAEL